MGDKQTKGQMSGRNRRLLYEWRKLDERLARRNDITYSVIRQNAAGMPVGYDVTYHIKSICGVEHPETLDNAGAVNPPVFASEFVMRIDIPENYPCIDAQPSFHFLTEGDGGEPMAHPWHPNIRYFGEMAGRVCLNMPDTYTDIVWCVERVAEYLRYDLYHAIQQPPYPEDLKVAGWVRRQGEPNGWIYFDN